MLHIQVVGCLLKGRQIFVNYWLLFLSWPFKAMTDSQIGTVPFLDGSSGVDEIWSVDLAGIMDVGMGG